MRNSTLKAGAASLAAAGLILSLGTSPVLARGGGGHGGGGVHFGGGGLHAGGGDHAGGGWNGGYHGYHPFYGGYNACTMNPYSGSQNPANPYSC